MKELGVIVYNCSCLVLDLQRIFALYSSLKYKNKIPPSWSKRLYGVYDTQNKLTLQLNETKSEAFVSVSSEMNCREGGKGRGLLNSCILQHLFTETKVFNSSLDEVHHMAVFSLTDIRWFYFHSSVLWLFYLLFYFPMFCGSLKAPESSGKHINPLQISRTTDGNYHKHELTWCNLSWYIHVSFNWP